MRTPFVVLAAVLSLSACLWLESSEVATGDASPTPTTAPESFDWSASAWGGEEEFHVRWSLVRSANRYRVRVIDGPSPGLEMETAATEMTVPAPDTSVMTVEILALAHSNVVSTSPPIAARVAGTGRNSVGPRTLPSWSAPIVYSPPGIAAGDFNGDGFDDVAVSDRVSLLDWNLRMTVYWGSSAGLSTSGEITWEGAPYRQATALATADVNGDAFADLLFGQQGTPGRVCAFLSSGDGSFSPPTCVDIGQPTGNDSQPDRILNMHDLDGDGHQDIVVRSRSGNAWQTKMTEVFAGSAAGLASEAVWVDDYIYYGERNFGATGDVTGDGRDDLLQTVWTNPALSFVASSGGALASAPLWTFEAEFPFWQVSSINATHDLTGDGVHDVIVGRANEDLVQILAGVPSGVPTQLLELTHPQYVSLGQEVGSFSDVTRDSHPDVWYTQGDPNSGVRLLRLLPGGSGGPSDEHVWSIRAVEAWEIDANGDLRSEVLARDGSLNRLNLYEVAPVTFPTLDLGGHVFGSIEDTFVGNVAINDPSGDKGRCVWFWGDGNETVVDPCPATSPPTHTFASEGRYTIRVEYTNSVGVFSSAVATWIVE